MKILLPGILIIAALNLKAQSFDIGEQFFASGYMGDTGNIEIFSAHREHPHTAPLCFMIRYSPGGKLGWAGLYWQNSADNWGDEPGFNFSDSSYTKIVFWAKGENGTEIVEFKAGGINTKQNKDSFLATTKMRRTSLTKDWVQYEIVLSSQKLLSVIGGFAWSVSTKDNPSGVTFYLDDIQFVR